MNPRMKLLGIVALIAISLVVYAYGKTGTLSPDLSAEGKRFDCLVTLKNPFYLGNTYMESISCTPKGTCNPLFYFTSARPLSLFGEQGTVGYSISEGDNFQSYDIGEGGRATKEFKVCTRGSQIQFILKDDDGNILEQQVKNT